MPQEANGYLTSDGVFYQEKSAAIFHEARIGLEQAVAALGLDPTKIIPGIIDKVIEPLEDYINAIRTSDAVLREKGTEDRKHNPDERQAEEEFETVFDQSVAGREYVPAMGRGKRAEEVQDRSPKHGFGGRLDDAPSVRRGPDLATRPYSEAARPRTSDGRPNIRPAPLERDIGRGRTQD